MADMFTVLEADHRGVKSMLAQLQAPASAAARASRTRAEEDGRAPGD
jgi:hypothetical protein